MDAGDLSVARQVIGGGSQPSACVSAKLVAGRPRAPYDALAGFSGSSIQAKGAQVAKTNFTFEKRRKELDRKKKREAKLQAKLDKRAAASHDNAAPTPETVVPEADTRPRPGDSGDLE